MRKRYIFEETGEVRPPKEGEWHLWPPDDEPCLCKWNSGQLPYPILTRRVEEVVCTGLSDHTRTQCPTCGEFTIKPARVEEVLNNPVWEALRAMNHDRAENLEVFAKAFMSATGLNPEECEMCSTIDAKTNTQRIWFRKREVPPVEPEPKAPPPFNPAPRMVFPGARLVNSRPCIEEIAWRSAKSQSPPEPSLVPKCKRDGNNHVTVDYQFSSNMDEATGRTFQFRRCIHCGEGVENETASWPVVHPPPEPSLKPCPFCGGKAVYDGSQVFCEDCGASSDNGLMQSEATAAWNRRTP